MTRYGLHEPEKLAARGPKAKRRLVSRSPGGPRHTVLACAATAIALLYGGRLIEIQLLKGAEYKEIQLRQSNSWMDIPAVRGRILDRNGEVLAAPDTRHAAYLAVNELAVTREEALGLISSVVTLTPARRAAVEASQGGWVRFAAGLTDEQHLELKGLLTAGLHFESASARAYPRGGLARQLVGHVGVEGEGATGLELALNDELAGAPGRAEYRRDGKNQRFLVPESRVIEPRPGNDVILTIDAGLQRIAESELARAIEGTGAAAGDIVLLDPRTGELLAIASQREGAAGDRIPVLTDPYEPGSTAKPFLLASLLEEGLVDLEEEIDVHNGRMVQGSRTITDVHGYDILPVHQVISKSSNVGAVKLSRRLARPVQHRYLRDFGFGMRTGVGHLAESSGRLSGYRNWSALSQASLAMGYEMSATSLQMAAAYGALANDGVLMPPALIREIRSPEGTILRPFDPEPVRRVISSETAELVKGVLEEVVREGTARRARLDGVTLAGKTGTARLAVNGVYAPDRHRASFIGFAPSEDPTLVILTRLEDPTTSAYYGGEIAAPASRATLEAALASRDATLGRPVALAGAARQWNFDPDEAATRNRVLRPRLPAPGTYFVLDGAGPGWQGPTSPDPQLPDIEVPDLQGLALRPAAALLHELGLRVSWEGSTVVAEQEPAPGATVPVGSVVTLR